MTPQEELARVIADRWEANQKPVFDRENPKVGLHHTGYGAEEITAFTEQMISTYVTMGPKVKEFEQSFCNLLGYQHGVSNNSGSSANLLMLAALANHATEDRLYPGDEIIIPALTWSTSIWPVIQMGLVPVLVDSDKHSLNIDPTAIEAAIGPKTRAIMAVPIYGNPCDMDAILTICDKHNLILIEDSCESMGATYDGKAVGSFGRVSSFSFYYSHHITTLEGGICVTADEELAELMRILRAHGWVRQTEHPQKWLDQYPDIDPKFLFVNEGYNLRITEPQAAMGLVQLKKLNRYVEARRRHADYYLQHLAQYSDAFRFQDVVIKGEHSWFGFPIVIKEGADFSLAEIRTFLAEKGIETRPIIAGNLARQPAMAHYEHRISGELQTADDVMNNGFAIGCHQHLTEEATAYVVDCFAKFLAR